MNTGVAARRCALRRGSIRLPVHRERRWLSNVPLWIDNGEITSTGASMVHPNIKAIVHQTVSYATKAHVEQALSSGYRAFTSWRRTPVTDRRNILMNAASLLAERGDEFKSAWTSEMSVSSGFADFNIGKSVSILQEIASQVSIAMEGSVPSTAQGDAGVTIVSREPFGVCLTMSPWNAALILSIRSIASALVAGNAVLLKTSEQTPHTHFLWGQLFADAGLPPGVLNILHTSRSEAPAMTKRIIEDPLIRHVSFTGSTAVGRHIGRMAGEALKPCILELGGKAPVVILPDADVEKAANNVIFHATLNDGQICMSTERVIVPASIKDSFIASLKRQLGTPRMSSLSQESSAQKINNLVVDAKGAGARSVADEQTKAVQSEEQISRGEFAVTILDEVNEDMDIWREETFGPVCVIRTVDDSSLDTAALDDELVRQANDSEYGLAASIYSADLGRALAMAKRLESGMVRINQGTVADDPVVPFGGVKQSGFGRFNGLEGIRQFTYLKSTSFPLNGPSMLPLP